MPAGFRKSLFGFNSDDVMEYIEKTHKSFAEKETVLNEKIEDLDTKLSDAKSQIAEIIAQKEQLEAELKVYTDKYEEIERLSQNIGRLYLVAETNANSVIESAKKSFDISRDEISKNIACADSTFSSLAALKEEINKTSADFTEKINSLLDSLEKAKDNIGANNSDANVKIEQYEELVKSMKVNL